jgi:hypothetical protein
MTISAGDFSKRQIINSINVNFSEFAYGNQPNG